MYRTSNKFKIENNLVYNLKRVGKHEVNDVCIVVQAKHLNESELASILVTIKHQLNIVHYRPEK